MRPRWFLVLAALRVITAGYAADAAPAHPALAGPAIDWNELDRTTITVDPVTGNSPTEAGSSTTVPAARSTGGSSMTMISRCGSTVIVVRSSSFQSIAGPEIGR